MDIIIPYASFIFIGGLILSAIAGIFGGLVGIYIILDIRIKND